MQPCTRRAPVCTLNNEMPSSPLSRDVQKRARVDTSAANVFGIFEVEVKARCEARAERYQAAPEWWASRVGRSLLRKIQEQERRVMPAERLRKFRSEPWTRKRS